MEIIPLAWPFLIIDDLGMRRLPLTAAEDLLEIIMRRYERASTLVTSNRPVEDWGKLLGDAAAVSAMLDRRLENSAHCAEFPVLRGITFEWLCRKSSNCTWKRSVQGAVATW